MTGIKTEGVGSSTASHLNLTRTLADVWADEEAQATRRRHRRQGRPVFEPRRVTIRGTPEGWPVAKRQTP